VLVVWGQYGRFISTKLGHEIEVRLLEDARGRIAQWWGQAYLSRGEAMARRFGQEAAASLPGLSSEVPVEAIQDGMALKRLQLETTQRIPEWGGP